MPIRGDNFRKPKECSINKYIKTSAGKYKKLIKHLDLTFENIDQTKLEVILLGDLNVDFVKNADPNTKKVNHFISQTGLTKLISGNTRYGNSKDSCIDKIITNSNHIMDSGI